MSRSLVSGNVLVAFFTTAFCGYAPTTIAQTQELEMLCEFDRDTPPGNIAVTPDDRIFISQHQFYNPQYRVVEVLPDCSTQPFPSERWSLPPDERGIGLNNVLGINADKNGILWMLDRAPGNGEAGRLVGWDTRSDTLHRIIYLAPPLIPASHSFLNDLAIDSDRNAIYIADTATPDKSALLVIDLETGYVRRVLEGRESVTPEDIPIEIDNGEPLVLGGREARVGVNPITIDADNEWVYFGPMSGRSLYRVRSRDLLDLSLSSEELESRVERYGDRPNSDGITVDGGGNVYITDINNNAIGVVDATGEYRVLYQDDRLLSWSDGFAFGPDGFIYLTSNQLHRSPPFNQGDDRSVPPFYLLRFPSLEPGEVGR